MSTFVRLLLIPLHRALLQAAKQGALQTAVNVSMIMAARCAAQSHDVTEARGATVRDPDEVALLVVAGLFDLLAPFIENDVTYAPMMNAVRGLMVSPSAVELIDPQGALIAVLKVIVLLC